ncbi:MAG: 16S rRNA (guanine(527)-N(7))-methyltransferase RsmG [Clostridia bacterium]|nr:16S rRNA (guanine(527)-N(7))-methyltransferase RsmG [Clostridia bacterium]
MYDAGPLLRASGVPMTEDAIEKLNRYLEMLIDWNGRMDLTSVPPQDMAEKHFLDSLLPLTQEGLFPAECSLIDVGTGAGFPGLALAIARPDCRVTLLEAMQKRCQFLQAVCDELGLANVRVIQNRAEIAGQDAAHREQYDRAVARAVAPLNVLCEYLLPFVQPGGMALCWKGPAAEDELPDGSFAAKALGGEMGEMIELSCNDTRHVIVPVKKITETLPQYPRKNGIPAKRPLKSGKK